MTDRMGVDEIFEELNIQPMYRIDKLNHKDVASIDIWDAWELCKIILEASNELRKLKSSATKDELLGYIQNAQFILNVRTYP